MIIEPRTRGFICLTSHPTGCEQNVKDQIAYVQSKGKIEGAKKVLVIGASTGFGLASRITSAFGSDAATIGVFFDKPATEGKPGSPGFYNTAAFEQEATKAGLYAKSINGDAFSNQIKEQVVNLIKQDLGQIDLVIYSLASPVRMHPVSGKRFKSTLKPIGEVFTNKTVDFHTGKVSEISINPAQGDDVANTVTVMGGEDWKMWMDALQSENLLSEGATTVAYSYIGPEVTKPVYRNGTIGAAKDDLEATAFTISDDLKSIGGKAYVSVNKALVTQASSAIPVIPLYISLLFKVMKEKGIHEGCIEQIQRLYSQRLFGGDLALDEKGRIRVDDWEMREDVQAEIAELWEKATTENLSEIGDLEGYSQEFFKLFGFKVAGINYDAEVNEVVSVPSIQ
ncbi:trans-2-enoyl-CoA reductase family protein [Tenacibaculum finnmarkense]|uniref:Enoyl-[acyl-carrier-protein] reductase [NADH] n=2 Tax=Tenacibaculum finnmarkense TaxID=2781243 RepID=A0A2I2MAM4_9FLAO|nr:enoyl-ACP reductase FabV [Tenacibaculum finnmarkense]MBE7653110.1 enoyl-[acyl-carrier-protein] reductase FabV [Tenacibaculum finnmarkense genomovar finnmarkense]MBE7695411.1 enoyl-[acyl-carrier-protein] reductase FabV [Tenacibaculum finnmarkense genomovar finnmarkense]MBE7698424.1 enoyl-[acyl-carrier-protein] reductase FabV [Tenacibaculum finnmarkense genomovar ulcerans]MCD8400862.1 trans-2-enoyl-CoA reductase family protein [Tenacibaculum finnmarkense genomovar ulcerans]MCD8403411.1 trans-